MASKHELEIEIDATGQVQVRVKGAKGKQCLQYVELFNRIGEVSDQKTTSEFYEPDPNVGITDSTRTRFGK